MKQFYVFALFVLSSLSGFCTTPLTGVSQVGATNSLRVTWGETDVNLTSSSVSLDRYQVSYGEVGQPATLVDNISNTLREFTISGLTYGKTYEVRVTEVIRVIIPPSPFTPPFLETFTPSSPQTVFLVVPNSPPTARCKSITKSADSGCSVMITAGEIDNGSSDPENALLTYTLNTTGPFSVGGHTVTLTVTDPGGLSSSCTATVTVVDDTAPAVVTKEAVLFLDGSGGAVLSLNDVLVGFSDNCGTISNVELSKTVFRCSDLGEQQVRLSVSDNSGNVSRTNVKVTVRNTLRPQIIPQNQSFHLAANGFATLRQETLNSMARGNCGIVEVRADKTTFSCADLGDNVVTVTAKDGSGNESSATIIVNIRDITPPTAFLKDAVVYLDGNGQGVLRVNDVNNGSRDNCVLSQIELSQTAFTCGDLGEREVVVFLLDKSGNSTYARSKVMVRDTMRPVVGVKPITLTLGANGRAMLSLAATESSITDNCGIVSVELSKTEFTQADLGEQRVRISAKDAAGNEGSAIILVRVVDHTPPQVSVQNLTLFANTAGEANLSVSEVKATVQDAGKVDSMYLSQNKFSYPRDSLRRVQLMAVDMSGNVGVGEFMVTLKDTANRTQAAVAPVEEPNSEPTTKGAVVTAGEATVEQPIVAAQTLNAAETVEMFSSFGPNPTGGEVQIFFNEKQAKVPEIKLTDLSGRAVQLLKKPRLINSQTLSVEMGHLQTGVYLLTVQQEYEQKTVKIVKE